ncbi:MAG: two-component regulator propeller domain-containing protein [Pyrinomonadaceae bacterium]
MRKFRSIFPFVFCIFFVAAAATAQYRSDLWTTENGLPQNTVTSILQTGDGYIWFGTFGGLARFDGIKFKIFNTINAPAFKTNRITGLSESKDGTLWIGGQNGSLVSYKDEIFTPVIEKPVAQRTPLFTICGDKNGAVWISGPTGLERYAPGASGSFVAEHIELPNEPNPQISGIVEDDANNIWISTSNALYQYQNGAIKSFFYQDNFPLAKDESGKIIPQRVSISIDRKNRLWLASNDFLARFEDGKIIPVIQKKDANFSIVENIDGSFLLKSENKIYRFADDKIGELLIDAPDIFARFRGMLADREGNLWLGTTGKGLVRYKQQTARTFGKNEGLTDSDVFFVFEDRDKNIWIGSDYLYKFRDGKFEIVEKNGRFTSAFQTRDGTLWFGKGDELLTYKDGKFTDFAKELNSPSRMVFEDRKGTLWFPTEDGLITLSEGRREQFSAENGFINSRVQSIFEDRDGGIWFAMAGGASRFKDGAFTNFTSKDGLSDDNVRDIYEDRDGVIWFGTYGGGLNRFKDGKFFAATTREGMNEDIVSRIIVDEKDNFWLLGNRGVSVISRVALNDLADGRIKTIACASYGVSDGMLNSEGSGGNFPAGWLASDGRFWFPSIQGAIVIDPKFSDLPPPPVFIEDVFLAGKQLEAKPEIEVSPDTGNLEIYYTGLHFTKPEQVKFKYKLEGFDRDWIEVGTRRTAYYTQIPPGNYCFLVTASTTNGVWNEQPASKTVVVFSNPIWKKWWFILTASLFVIAAIVVFYRLRLMQLEKSRGRQQTFARQLIESQEKERKRIAGELHDGLGQTLLIIKNRAFLGTKAETREIANEQFNEISASSGAAINQAREIAYFLRPSQLERLGLTSAIEEMITQADESSEIDFECEIDSLDNFFSPEDEINFFRIVQESVNNVLKHSEASKAKVFVSRNNDKIELLVQDNGKGFASEKSNIHGKSGFGLIGMEERVRILGGKIHFISEIGKGAKVFVEIKKERK